MYYVYIVTNKFNHVLYIGITSSLAKRIFEHREHLIEGFTQQYNCTKLVFYEGYPDPDAAIRREKQLKGWRREKKLSLIQTQNPQWNDLYDEVVGPEEKRIEIPKP
jgi:putative endonuclease